MSLDLVNSPPHYKDLARVECIAIIEDLKLPYHLGNTLKYIWRAGHKDSSKTLEDLKKARWYLDRYIKMKEEEINTNLVLISQMKETK